MSIEMTSDDLIKKINTSLQSGWTIQECRDGKKIIVKWTWAKAVNDIVKKYKDKGWIVTKHVEIDGAKRFLFLTFKNAYWEKNPDQRKKTRR